MSKSLLFIILTFITANFTLHAQEVHWWLSSEDGTQQLSQQPALSFGDGNSLEAIPVDIDPTKTYQSILGLGSSLEHATCHNLSKLPEPERNDVIRRIVDPELGIGMNLMRICIGTSDFVGEPWYSYNDLPDGNEDLELEHFSIEKDREYVLPVLKKALEYNPDLLFFASPWSPPGWMKTTGVMMAGKLKPEYYGAYAHYLAKFIKAYEAEGIPIYAMTPQNEPAFPNPDYPTCAWKPDEQRDFIRDHLGPEFEKQGIKTLIWCWDHNWNYIKFPQTVLDDPQAAKYVQGTGFHLYEGMVDAQSALQDMFPDKDIYFTEGSTFRTRGALQIMNILRNWARSYNAWVTLLDEHRKPNNGSHTASATCIELQDDLSVKYSYDYYMYGHFMKFIPRGAVRIESSAGDRHWQSLAFANPDDSKTLVLANSDRNSKQFQVNMHGNNFQVTLPARSTATFTWQKS